MWPLFVSLSSGSSIQRCAVAFEAEWIDVWSSFELLERGDQPRRVAGELHARRVGEVLPLAAHRELHDVGDDRGEDQQHEPEDHEHDAERVVLVVVASARRRKNMKRRKKSESSAIIPTIVTVSVITRMS